MMADKTAIEQTADDKAVDDGKITPNPSKPKASKPKETGGPKGPEPTRYGDWERNGIASDF